MNNLSELLKYSSEYERMNNNFNKVYSAEDAKKHPILHDYDLDDYLFHPLIAPTDIEDYIYFSRSIDLGEREVPKRMIIGTTHPSYQGMTWLEMLTSHPRVICKTDAEVMRLLPYEKQEQKIHLLKYGEQYFIANGNNRICQAQFVDKIDKIPCQVTEFIFDQKGVDRNALLSSAGAEFAYQGSYKEGDIVKAGYKGITFRFPYTKAGVDRCVGVLAVADAINKNPLRRYFFKLMHRKTSKEWFNLEVQTECNEAVRAVLERMLLIKSK